MPLSGAAISFLDYLIRLFSPNKYTEVNNAGSSFEFLDKIPSVAPEPLQLNLKQVQDLLSAAYGAKYLSLQLIHLVKALGHLTLALVAAIGESEEKVDIYIQEIISLQQYKLGNQIEDLLDEMSRDTDTTDRRLRSWQRRIDQCHDGLISGWTGAVEVHRSQGFFHYLEDIDWISHDPVDQDSSDEESLRHLRRLHMQNVPSSSPASTIQIQPTGHFPLPSPTTNNLPRTSNTTQSDRSISITLSTASSDPPSTPSDLTSRNIQEPKSAYVQISSSAIQEDGRAPQEPPAVGFTGNLPSRPQSPAQSLRRQMLNRAQRWKITATPRLTHQGPGYAQRFRCTWVLATGGAPDIEVHGQLWMNSKDEAKEDAARQVLALFDTWGSPSPDP